MNGSSVTFLAFALQPRKTSARRPSDEGAVRPIIASNGVPSLQMRSVGSQGWQGEGRKEGKDLLSFHLIGGLVSLLAHLLFLLSFI